MSRTTPHDDWIRQVRDEGHMRDSELGEMLTWPSIKVRDEVCRRWGLDHPDWDTKLRNIKKFQRSDEYKRYSGYHRKLY